jgi:hypothetical protein
MPLSLIMYRPCPDHAPPVGSRSLSGPTRLVDRVRGHNRARGWAAAPLPEAMISDSARNRRQTQQNQDLTPAALVLAHLEHDYYDQLSAVTDPFTTFGPCR